MLEWYRAAAGLDAMIEDTRLFVNALAEGLGCRRALPETWPTFRVDALFKACAGLELDSLQDVDVFRAAARTACGSVVPTDDWNDVFCKVFMERVEPELARHGACFVTHYPVQMGALARREGGGEGQGKPYVERFEAYLFGVEICNGYCELTDALELRERFNAISRSRGGNQGQGGVVVRDAVFEDVMAHGLPPCSGNALGLDRVAALLLGLESIAPLFCLPFLSQFSKGAVAKD
jgi:lysyl-tRNA synthetase class 2